MMLRRLWNIARLGLVWMVIWGALGAGLSMVVGVVDPQSIGPGEGPVDVARILGGVGAGSGIVFGLLLTVAERQRRLGEVRLLRVAFWGALAGASLPLLTSINDSVLVNTIPLGSLTAMASVAFARIEVPRAEALR